MGNEEEPARADLRSHNEGNVRRDRRDRRDGVRGEAHRVSDAVLVLTSIGKADLGVGASTLFPMMSSDVAVAVAVAIGMPIGQAIGQAVAIHAVLCLSHVIVFGLVARFRFGSNSGGVGVGELV